jgi:hypothetical protein
LLGINQDAPIAPQAATTGPLYASKQAHEWLEKVDHPRSLDQSGRLELPRRVRLAAGKGHTGTKASVAMANAARAPQRGRVQL